MSFYQQFEFPNLPLSSTCFEARKHGKHTYPPAVTVYFSHLLQIFPQANAVNVDSLTCTLLKSG